MSSCRRSVSEKTKARASSATTASTPDPGWSEPCWASLAAPAEVERDCETRVAVTALAAGSPGARSDGKSTASSAETERRNESSK